MNINENRTQTLYNYDKVKDLKKKATISIISGLRIVF